MGEPALKLVEWRETPPSRTLLTPFLISIAFHLLVLSTVPLAHWNSAPAAPTPREKITRVRFPESPTTTTRPPIEGKVVDLLDQRNISDRPPDNAQFLSDKNRRVEKETQARVTGPNPTTNIGIAGSGDGRRPGSEEKRESRREGSRSLPGIGKRGFDLHLPESFLREERQVGERGTGAMAALAPSNYLPEIAMGDETLLNTAEFAYSIFYVRMKRQMEAVWNPSQILRHESLRGSEYVTVVGITLDQRGDVDQVYLVRTSGSRALDEEALSTVRKGAPYLNPPEALRGRDGFIRIPQWHFIVTLRSFL